MQHQSQQGYLPLFGLWCLHQGFRPPLSMDFQMHWGRQLEKILHFLGDGAHLPHLYFRCFFIHDVELSHPEFKCPFERKASLPLLRGVKTHLICSCICVICLQLETGTPNSPVPMWENIYIKITWINNLKQHINRISASKMLSKDG